MPITFGKDPKPSTLPEKVETAFESPVVIVEVAVPKDLYEQYKEQAANQGVTLEEAVVSRMRRCFGHDAIRGLYLSDADRKRIESWLKKSPIETPGQMLDLLDSIFTVGVTPFEPIAISAAAFKRLMLRDGYGGKSAQSHLGKIVQDALVRALGVN